MIIRNRDHLRRRTAMHYRQDLAVARALELAAMWDARGIDQRKAMVLDMWSGEHRPWLRNWCGAFVATCIEAGGADVRPGERRGARRLTRAIAERGAWSIAPLDASSIRDGRGADAWGRAMVQSGRVRTGDVMCWYRGRPRTWRAHVAIVTGFALGWSWIEVVEGNAGGVICRRRLQAKVWPMRASGLYGVARPA